mmetsp:Transcript_3244/g.5696  ORF Transcript_3244/g.5696 Transcript_3244/m.5696 type:complete len:202 (+) Transcript_3244:1316-1921(+)
MTLVRLPVTPQNSHVSASSLLRQHHLRVHAYPPPWQQLLPSSVLHLPQTTIPRNFLMTSCRKNLKKLPNLLLQPWPSHLLLMKRTIHCPNSSLQLLQLSLVLLLRTNQMKNLTTTLTQISQQREQLQSLFLHHLKTNQMKTLTTNLLQQLLLLKMSLMTKKTMNFHQKKAFHFERHFLKTILMKKTNHFHLNSTQISSVTW